MSKGFQLAYRPDGATLKAFMRDNSFVRALRGHVGSGKSVACAVELFRRAMQQEPDDRGIRATRWVVVRNTFPQLKSTTIATWLRWFPEDVFGKFNWGSPPTHRIRLTLGDDTRMEMETIFLPLDSELDVRKLLSLDLTGGWINEARELPKAIVDGLTSRVRRFPDTRDGGSGPTWSGVIMDTNPPPEDHWWAIMSGDRPPPDWMSEADRRNMVAPEGWRFFAQPPALLEQKDERGEVTGYVPNPRRDNAKFLSDRYYEDMIPGKSRDWISVYLLNEYGSVFEGRPVYPTFAERVHVAASRLQPFPGHPVFVGLDFGLTPAATFGQFVRGRHFLQRELVATGMGILRFIPLIKAFMAEHYPGYEFRLTGDPAGEQRVQTDERTPFDILRAHDLHAVKAPTNDPTIRQGAVEQALGTMIDGEPGYLVSPCCTAMIAGFKGGYHFASSGTAEKNAYSHPHDAEQYRMLGAGAGRALLNRGQKPAQPVVLPSGFSPRQVSRLQAPSSATKVVFRNLR